MREVDEEKTNRNEMEGSSTSVIILSSDDDEEDERETKDLFEDFLAKVQPYIASEVVVLIRIKLEEARSDFVSSSHFRNLLQRKIQHVGVKDAYIHTGEVCKVLCDNARKDTEKPDLCQQTSSSSAVIEIGENSDSARARAETNAGQFENENRGTSSGEAPNDLPNSKDMDDDIMIVEIPRTNVLNSQKVENPSNSQSDPLHPVKLKAKSKNSKEVLSPRKRKKTIRRLEEKMKHISDQIRILNQAELSLDEMGMSDSTYIQECRLKERFNRIWNKICNLQGRPPNTGRVTEKEVKCPSTGYPGIDEEVQKFMKNRRSFPDIFDLKEVINKANRKHDLRISAPVLLELAEEVFTNLGNKLQRRRKIDYEHNFGCFLTDEYKREDDPALQDTTLTSKLEKNHKKSKRALNKVFKKYVHYGRQKYVDGHGSQSLEISPDDCDSDKMERHPCRIGNYSSSDASGSESNKDSVKTCKNKGTKEYSDGPDHFESSQETASASQSETSSAVLVERHSPQSTANVLEMSRGTLEGSLEDNSNHIRSPNNQAVVTLDDADYLVDNQSGRTKSEQTVSVSENPSQTDCSNGADQAKSPGISAVIGSVDDCISSSQSSTNDTQPNSVMETAVEGLNIALAKEKTAATTSSEILSVAYSSCNGTGSRDCIVDKVTSPLSMSVNIKPISLHKEMNSSKSREMTSEPTANAKRPAEDDLIMYESPLKVFRKTTLGLLHGERSRDAEKNKLEMNKKELANGCLFSNPYQGKNREISGESTHGNSASSCGNTPKKSLSFSLKRSHGDRVSVDKQVATACPSPNSQHGRTNPLEISGKPNGNSSSACQGIPTTLVLRKLLGAKASVDKQVDIIVLSDDDSE